MLSAAPDIADLSSELLDLTDCVFQRKLAEGKGAISRQTGRLSRDTVVSSSKGSVSSRVGRKSSALRRSEGGGKARAAELGLAAVSR